MGWSRCRPGHRTVRVAVAGVLALLAAGCAAMPDSGPVSSAANSGSSQNQSQVWIYPQAPTPNESPRDVVNGFLEALTSDEPGFETARQYLTRAAARSWRPNSQTTVVGDDAGLTGGSGARVEYGGTEVGQLDSTGFYSPASPGERYSSTFRLVKQAGQWRIATPPPGVVMDELDFQRIFTAYNLYYLDPYDSRHQLVPCQVYLRSGNEATALTAALLAGPCPSLQPVVADAMPEDVALAAGQHVSLDDGNAQVELNSAAQVAGATARHLFAVQLYWTLQQAGANTVRITAGSGKTFASVSSNDPVVQQYGGSVAPAASPQPGYFVDGGRVVELTGTRQQELSFGSGLPHGTRFGSIAVSPDGRRVAAITQDGTEVYVGSPTDPTPRLWYAGSGLASPSWDAMGELWLLAGAGSQSPSLLTLTSSPAVPDGAAVSTQVQTADVGGALRMVRVAPDGFRVVLLYGDGSSEHAAMGVIERQVDRQQLISQVVGIQPIFQQLVDISDVEWAGPQRLAALGRAQPAVAHDIYQVYDDGSPVPTPAVQALGSMQWFAATDNGPMLGEQDEGGQATVYEYTQDGTWMPVQAGSAPVYPGD